MRTRVATRTFLLAATAPLGCLPLSAQSAESRLELFSGFSYSTNIDKREVGASSESIALVGLEADVSRAGTFARLQFKSDVAYYAYLQNTFDNELLGRADAQVDLLLVGDRVKWVTVGSYGQVQVNPSNAATPDNREAVRYVATGPDLRFQLGNSGFALITGRVSDADYAVSELDGARAAATLEVGRRFSRGGSISLNASIDSLKFDRSVDYPDYDRTAFYITYEGKASRTGLTLIAGIASVDATEDKQSNPLVRLSATRALSPSSSLGVYAGTWLTDVTDSFRALTPLGAPVETATGRNPLTAATFRRDDVELRWEYDKNRINVVVAASWTEDSFSQNANFDISGWGARASVTRQVTPVLSVQMLGSIGQGRYRLFDILDRGWVGALQVSYRLTRRLSVSGGIEIERRDAAISFSDERATLLLRFAPQQ